MKIILIILYRVLLDISYFEIISPSYAYMGFDDCMTGETAALSWILLVVSVWIMNYWMDGNKMQGSGGIMACIYLISFIPMTTCICAGIISGGCLFWSMIYYFILFGLYAFVSRTKAAKRFLLKLYPLDIEKTSIYFVLCICVCTIIYISYQYTGIRINFDLDKVYELRSDARRFHIPILFGYIYSMSRSVIPLLFGYLLLNKRYCVSFFVFWTQCLSFGIDGSKSSFFMLFFVLLTIFIYEKIPKVKIDSFLLIVLVFILLLGFLEKMLFESIWIDGRIIRRMMFTQAYLHKIYYEFFSILEPDFLRSSVLRHFGFISPYAASGGVPYTIGAYLGHPDLGANNGLFSDALAIGGLVGIFVLPVVIVPLLYLFEVCAMGLPRQLVLIAALQVSFSLISSSVGTVLVTHGLLLMMFCMVVMSRDGIKDG